jgi:hypothetical protein
LFHVGHDDAEAWKVVVLNDDHDTQMIILFSLSRLGLKRQGCGRLQAKAHCAEDNKQDRMARNLREVIAAVSVERCLKKKRQLEEAKRVMELDSNLVAIAVIITGLPIIPPWAGCLPPSLWATERTSSGSSSILAAILRALAGCTPGPAI